MYQENYFIYKNVAYGIGTKVIFNNNVQIQYYSRPHDKIPVFEFVAGYDNGRKCFNYKTSDNVQCASVDISSKFNLDEEIAEIVEPVYVKLVPWQKQAVKNIFEGKVYADVFGGVLIYIVVMLVGAIFVDRWLIWIAATAVFIGWLLHQYRT